MRTKLRERWKNFKAGLIIFLMKKLFWPKDREFVIMWTQLKLGVIEKPTFDVWMTKEVLGDGEKTK